MICAKCGTEYEGSQCPKCEGPVIKVNNSDYLARRKAYEEKQARLKELEALKADSTDNDDTDKVSDNDNTSNKKNHTQKSKDYDEGVFDITKVDFGEVADKLKSEKDKIVASGNKLLKAVGEKAKNGKQIDKGGKNGDKAIVRIVEWPDEAKNPLGEVVDILGVAGQNTAEMHAILAEFGLPYTLSLIHI